MQDQTKAAALLQKYMTTETDTTFKSLFTDEEYELINKCSKENLMFDIAMLPKVKPAFLSNNLIVILYMKHVGGFNPQEQLDTYFQTQATEKGKRQRAWKRWTSRWICFTTNLLLSARPKHCSVL